MVSTMFGFCVLYSYPALEIDGYYQGHNAAHVVA